MRASAVTMILMLATSGAIAQAVKSQERVAAMPPARLAVDVNGVLRPVNPPDQPPQVIGGASHSVGTLTPSTGLSPRDIDHPCPGVPALTREAARGLVMRIATDENFFPDFVQSVARIESAFVSNAFSGRAYGLMQLTPATAARFQVDLCDPEGNVRGGIRYLRHLHAHIRNPLYILAAYNGGEQMLIERNGLPPTLETLTYIARVMDDFYDWPAIADGARSAHAEATAARDHDLAARPYRAAAIVASLPRDSQRARGEAHSAEAGPVEWQSGFVASFD
jgi:hypothetical protein